MKKYCAAALVIAVLLLGGCGQAAFETNSDNILPGREVTAYAETSDGTAGDGEVNTHANKQKGGSRYRLRRLRRRRRRPHGIEYSAGVL